MPIPLLPEFKTTPCVGSGHCCKTAACAFGEWDARRHACRHLVVSEILRDRDGFEIERYRCSRYEEIRTLPGAELNPAFGAGCCSPLFNTARSRIVRILQQTG
jgi:hypothetical protein